MGIVPNAFDVINQTLMAYNKLKLKFVEHNVTNIGDFSVLRRVLFHDSHKINILSPYNY